MNRSNLAPRRLPLAALILTLVAGPAAVADTHKPATLAASALALPGATPPPADTVKSLTFTTVTCQDYWKRDDPLNGHRVYELMRKLNPDFFVHTGDNVEIEDVIEVHHWISGANTVIFPHTLVVTGRSSKVRVIDIFRSADDITPGLAIAFNDLCAGQNSQLDYTAIQALNEVTRIIQINETATARDAFASPSRVAIVP